MWPQETRDIVVLYGINHISISLTIYSWPASVTDRQTDGQTSS